jgi:hypothetical protein
MSFRTLWVLFHTYTSYFILATTCFISVDIVSYLRMNFVCLHCFIPKHVISYLWQPVSYVYVLFHTYRCHFILATICFIPIGIVSYLHMSFQMKFVLPTSLYVRLLTTHATRHLFECFFAMYFVTHCPCPPRNGCDWHRLHPNARYRTHFQRVFKHDHIQYTCSMPELPIPGYTQVFACAPRVWRDVTIVSMRRTIATARLEARVTFFGHGFPKFISGVNMYNLSVMVQPRCEPSNTCEQNNPVWFTFYGIHHTVLVWTHKYSMIVPCWCDTRCMVWSTTYGVNKMSVVW